MGFGGGCCILIAFFWHYQHFGIIDSTTFGGLYNIVYRVSPWVVEMFFIISGFTMYTNYHEKIEAHDIKFLEYIRRRYRKLWPIATCSLCVVALLEIVYQHLYGARFVVENFDAYHFLLNVGLIQSGWFENSYSFNTPIWFVSTLILCYIVFYFVTIFNRKKRIDLIYWIPIIIGWILKCVNCSLPFMHADFAARGYYSFFIGVLLASVHENGKRKHSIVTYGLLYFLGMMTIILKKIVAVNEIGILFIVFVWIVFPTIIGSSFNRLVSKALSIKPLLSLGKISMDVYMWHFPVQILIAIICKATYGEIPYKSFLFYLIYICLTIFISRISFFARNTININGFWTKLKHI